MNAPKKKIYVILAFHAHQPIRDISDKLIETLGDPELAGGTIEAGGLLRHEDDKENIYKRLIQFSRSTNIPVTLSATNETLFKIRRSMPETYEALKESYKNKEIFPLYTFAHYTHMVLIHPDEIIDEIKLNREFLHYLMGVPHPRFRGVFPTAASLDGDKLAGITQSKMAFVALPHPDPSITSYSVQGTGDVKAFPFWIRPEVLAVPRHFSVSEDIIRLLMQGNPDVARSNGYPLGDFPVFSEEYSGKKLPLPIQKEDIIKDYTAVLRKAVEETPDKGLIFYMQELDPMGLGEQALDVLQESWKTVGDEGGVELRFATPDEYLAEINPKDMSLPVVTFNQVSWMPDIKVAPRVDGYYPPRGVEEFKGVRVSEQLYGRRPLIFWQAGCFMVETVEVVYETLGIHFDIGTTASKLADEDYDISRFEIPLQLAIHLRFIKNARNWEQMSALNDDTQKNPYIHLLCICNKIRDKYADVLPLTVRPLPGSLEGLIRSLDIIIQGRVDSMRKGVEATKQKDPDAIEGHLRNAEEKMKEAKATLKQVVNKPEGKLTVGELVEAVGSHARLIILATDSLQKAWQKCSDVSAMRDFCYKHAYEIFPPRFPKLLDELNRDYQGVR